MPAVGGQRYITSTAVFLNEVIKLAICLTVALYEVSKTVPPSMPATSLFGSLSAAIFTGDSWKLALPAALYTVSNSLQYIALSNMEAAQFQVTYQLELIVTAIFGVILMRRGLSYGKWMALFALFAGVALVQMPSIDSHELDRRSHIYLPRRLSNVQHFRAAAGPVLKKRSATYEGIQEDMIQGHPVFNGRIGLLATLGACVSSGLASVTFEKVLRDSSYTTSVWVRNVQLAIYSIFPALFIGVIFLDGEQVAKRGFFHRYNWIVWTVIGAQAIGGIVTSFCISYSELGLLQAAGAMSVIFGLLASPFFFDLQISANVSFHGVFSHDLEGRTHAWLQFILGAFIVLAACFIYIPGLPNSKSELRSRPPPIMIQNFEKAKSSPDTRDASGLGLTTPPNDFSIKLPTTPLVSDASALTTSRPGSPCPSGHHARGHSSRGYFDR
ncbi:UDP-galactose transporter Gms1 [Emydomyces testavorans]|uniref:UDP-galactose transporter Gms1 n=1 Tax=Emydomyces testavorans TaxID=2070801 RepID=A0AAF0DLX4_9EURO|nr:UDP-galactose transporter Gms1 [Emydomyces testavorans]